MSLEKAERGFILIVEDDRGANYLEASRLEPLGLEIKSAYSAGETLEILKAARPRLMLLDYTLPDMNALDLLSEIRKASLRVPPFILVTGMGDENLAVEAMRAEADDYIVKDSALLDNLADRAKKVIANAALKEELERATGRFELEHERYRVLVEGSFDLIYQIGTDDTVEYVNPAGLKFLGKTAAEVLGRPRASLFPAAVAARQKLALDRVFATGLPFMEENPAGPGETPAYQETNLLPVFGPDGRVASVLGVSRDITERKRADLRLRESEERFAALFLKAPIGYQSLDQDGNFLEVNEAWLDLMGYSREEVLGKWFGGFLAPQFKEAFRERFPVFKAKGKIHSEFRMRRKDGSEVFVVFEGRIGYRADGTFAQTHCVMQDVTEARLKEGELRLYAGRLDAVLLSSFVLAAGLDRGSGYVWVNEAYARCRGKAVDFFPGKKHFALYPDAQMEEAFGKALETGETFRQPAGSVSAGAWSLAPIKGEGGAVSEIVLTLSETPGQGASAGLAPSALLDKKKDKKNWRGKK